MTTSLKTTLAVSLLLPNIALAGTAIIPKFSTTPYARTCYSVSNISSEDTNITVNFFKTDGSLYTGPISSTTNIVTLGTAFILGPQKTEQFCFPISSIAKHGYGVIESNTSGPSQPSLVASGYYTNNTANYTQAYSIVINGGMPF